MDVSIFGIATVVAITVLCYLVGTVVKATPFDNNKYIPIACGFAALFRAACFAARYIVGVRRVGILSVFGKIGRFGIFILTSGKQRCADDCRKKK